MFLFIRYMPGRKGISLMKVFAKWISRWIECWPELLPAFPPQDKSSKNPTEFQNSFSSFFATTPSFPQTLSGNFSFQNPAHNVQYLIPFLL